MISKIKHVEHRHQVAYRHRHVKHALRNIRRISRKNHIHKCPPLLFPLMRACMLYGLQISPRARRHAKVLLYIRQFTPTQSSRHATGLHALTQGRRRSLVATRRHGVPPSRSLGTSLIPSGPPFPACNCFQRCRAPLA